MNPSKIPRVTHTLFDSFLKKTITPLSPPPIPAQSVKAESVMKGSDLTGDATATYVVDKDLSAELKLSDKGAAKVSVTKSGVVGTFIFILVLVRAIRLTSCFVHRWAQDGGQRGPVQSRKIPQGGEHPDARGYRRQG